MADYANHIAPMPWHPDACPRLGPHEGFASDARCSQGHGLNGLHAAAPGAIPDRPGDELARRTEKVVITFAGMTGQTLVARKMKAASRETDRVDRAKSRLLFTAIRDLGQRMQALMPPGQLLGESIEGEQPHPLLARLEQKLLVLSGMLSTLIDANRIEADCAETGIAIFLAADGPDPARATPICAVAMPQRAQPLAYIVDDNPHICCALKDLLEGHALSVAAFASAEAFLAAYRPGGEACLLLDAHLPGMSGLALLATLRGRGDHLPTILISGSRDVGLAVDAMRGGACDFLEKPMRRRDLLASITRAINGSHEIRRIDAAQDEAAARVGALTARQQEIMALVLAGHPSKNIAADLRISQRTVENHRAAIMQKMKVKSLPELARKAQVAEGTRRERLQAAAAPSLRLTSISEASPG